MERNSKNSKEIKIMKLAEHILNKLFEMNVGKNPLVHIGIFNKDGSTEWEDMNGNPWKNKKGDFMPTNNGLNFSVEGVKDTLTIKKPKVKKSGKEYEISGTGNLIYKFKEA